MRLDQHVMGVESMHGAGEPGTRLAMVHAGSKRWICCFERVILRVAAGIITVILSEGVVDVPTAVVLSPHSALAGQGHQLVCWIGVVLRACVSAFECKEGRRVQLYLMFFEHYRNWHESSALFPGLPSLIPRPPRRVRGKAGFARSVGGLGTRLSPPLTRFYGYKGGAWVGLGSRVLAIDNKRAYTYHVRSISMVKHLQHTLPEKKTVL